MEEFHKTVLTEENRKDSFINYFYNSKQIELEVPMPSLKHLLDDNHNFSYGKEDG